MVDVFWSVRSPYCYIGLDRALEIWEKHKVQTNLRPVYPIAIRDTAFFTDISNYMAYRIPYQGLDTLRSANFNNVPYAYPSPDPVIQAPNFGPVKPSRNRS